MSDHQTPGVPLGGDPKGRRRFLTVLTRAFLSLWGLGGAGVVAAYLRPRTGLEEPGERVVRVGMLDEFRVGEARLVRHGSKPFFVIRLDEQRVIAVSAVCTHVRCILGFDRDRRALTCPCHDGRFDLAGNVVSGPPPKPLPTYDASQRAGEIFVRV